MGNNKLATYTNWAPNEPNNFDKLEKCIHIYDTSISLQWNDLGCSDEMHFICERNQSYVMNNNLTPVIEVRLDQSETQVKD